VKQERELTASQLARLEGVERARQRMYGRGGNPPSAASVRRWINHGYGLSDGSVLRLEATRVGQDLLTLQEWVEAFERLRAEDGRQRVGQPVERPDRTRRASHRAAERYLDAKGVK
jgi:hypothetical protein